MAKLSGPALALACAALVAACGGGRSAPDFTLRDDAARAWTLSQQRGSAVLLTFGFTHCADTCPATLAKLARMTRTLGSRAGDVEIAFVTVDPARDDPATLHRFVGRFVPLGASRIVGLTGTRAQVRSVEDAYHVWSARLPSSAKHGGYDVAHSAAIFFIDPRGRLSALRDDADSEESLAQAVADMGNI